MKNNHSNVAFFVPHLGCKHYCSFCNQRTITGECSVLTLDEIEKGVQVAIQSLGESTNNAQIAFFGGSFTAIEKPLMESYLKCAYKYVKSGQFDSIRISTRPDAIDNEILDILKSYGVKTIELGAQSMCDDVLEANKRGHLAKDVVNASKLIKQNGFELGLQMMTGLYKDSFEKSIYTAKTIASLKPSCVRVYPTVVIEGTLLATLFKKGEYIPFDVESSVKVCSQILDIFEKENIEVIRLGLHGGENFEQGVLGGCWHPAFGELCQSERLYNKVIKELKKLNKNDYIINVCPKDISKMIGQKRCNIKRFLESGYNVKVKGDSTVEQNSFKIVKNY